MRALAATGTVEAVEEEEGGGEREEEEQEGKRPSRFFRSVVSFRELKDTSPASGDNQYLARCCTARCRRGEAFHL